VSKTEEDDDKVNETEEDTQQLERIEVMIVAVRFDPGDLKLKIMFDH